MHRKQCGSYRRQSRKRSVCFFFVCARLAVVYITADGDVIVKRVTTAYRYRKNKSKRFFCVFLHPEIVAVILMFFLWRPYLYNFLSDLSYLCVCVCWLYPIFFRVFYISGNDRRLEISFCHRQCLTLMAIYLLTNGLATTKKCYPIPFNIKKGPTFYYIVWRLGDLSFLFLSLVLIDGIVFTIIIRRSSAWFRCFSSASRSCRSAWRRIPTCECPSYVTSRSTGRDRSWLRPAESWTFTSDSDINIRLGTATGQPVGHWTRPAPSPIKPSSLSNWSVLSIVQLCPAS